MAALLGAAALCFGSPSATGQTTPKVFFESNETLFTVLSAINTCGYDDGLASSNPVRNEVRAEISKALEANPTGAHVQEQVCQFVREHQQLDASRELAQYVSLGLTLGPAPAFTAKSEEMPPDALYVQEFAPILQTFYQAAGLRDIWRKHQREYAAVLAHYHEAVSSTIERVDAYLRMPVSGYIGREYTIYAEPMAAPNRVNARIYTTEYFLVLSPNASGALNLEPVRHMYLHYILDPLAAKRPQALKRMELLLSSVIDAPMDESYKHEISLLITESLIHAIEARVAQDGKATEATKQQIVTDSMQQGFVLTKTFYEELVKFEKGEAGLKDAFGEMLLSINVDVERHRADQIVFARSAVPDPLHASPAAPRATSTAPASLLDQAEQKLATGDRQGAEQLAQQALTEKQGDQGRALFVLARTSRDIRGAQTYFERALEVAKEPRVVAWSHVYLGRIYDLRYRDALETGEDTPQGKAAADREREQAVQHYRAALSSGYDGPEMRTAAETGLKQPYEPVGRAQPQARNR
jgi:tetratricopeptide (TPR) repeat protein